MTTPDLTPEVVERIERLADHYRRRAEIMARFADGLPVHDPYRKTADDDADREHEAAADLRALLARLSHLEEQARKDGEALGRIASNGFGHKLRTLYPLRDAEMLAMMDYARARLSDREGK
jgi:hypothetical protein